MKIKQFLKSKMLKVISAIAAISTIVAISGTLVSNLHTSNKQAAINQANNQQNRISKANLRTNYRLINDPVINLDEAFINKYYLNQCVQYNSANQTYVPNLPQDLKDAIERALRINSYWYGGNVPTNVQFEYVSIIDSYHNSTSLGGFYSPAIIVKPFYEEIVGTSKTKIYLPITTVSIIGSKIMNGPTYPIDTCEMKTSGTNNSIASIVLEKPSTNIYTGAELRDFLFKNPYIFNSIFANLPELNIASNPPVSNFSLRNDDADISIGTGKLISNISSSNAKNHQIYQYDVILKKRFVPTLAGCLASKTSKTFSINVYYPDDPKTTVAKPLKIKQNVCDVSKSLVTKYPTAKDFEDLRLTNQSLFKSEIANLFFSNPSIYTENYDSKKYDFTVSTLTSGVSSVYNDLGMCIYKIEITDISSSQVVKRFNLVLSGFQKCFDAKLTNVYSINGISDSNGISLATRYASSFNNVISSAGTTNSKKEVEDIFNTIYNATSSISNVKPSFVELRSNSPQLTSSSASLASMFDTQNVSFDFSRVNYDDNLGQISNIRATIKGYYDESMQTVVQNPKDIYLTLCGFKRNDVNGITNISNITIGDEYKDYPAQSFLLPNTPSRINELQQGKLPETPSNVNNTLISNAGDEIKKMIKNATDNLPPDQLQNELNWKLKDLKIDNFSGKIIGKVYFPQYYIDANTNGSNVTGYTIENNLPDTDPNAKWFEFQINGFKPVSETTFDKLITQTFIYQDNYNVYQEYPTSKITYNDYKKLLSTPPSTLAEQSIYYWLEDNKIVDLSNRWFNFEKSIKDPKIGVNNVSCEFDDNNEIVKIAFSMCGFDSNGNFLRLNANNPQEPQIVISGFKKTSQIIPDSKIIRDATIPITSITVKPQCYQDVGTFYEFMKANEAKKAANTTTDQNYDKIIEQLTDYINNNGIATGINNNALPQYDIVFDVTSLSKNNPLAQYDTSYKYGADSNAPGILYFLVAFKCNFYENNNFVTSPVASPTKYYTLAIDGFNLIANTSISPVINAPKNITEDTTNNTLQLASKALLYDPNNPSLAVSNLKTMMDGIAKSIYNPKNPSLPENIGANDAIENEYVFALVDKQGTIICKYGANNTTLVDANNTVIDNTNVSNIFTLADNGESYFGELNNLDGSTSFYIKFLANKWYKDFALQTIDSDPIKVKAIGFKTLNLKQWFNSSIFLDHINDLTNLQDFDNNILPSNLLNSKLQRKLLSKITTVSPPSTNDPLICKNVKDYNPNNEPEYIIDQNDLRNLDFEANLNSPNNAKLISPNNANGSLNATLNIFGDHVFNPNNGLIYNKEQFPIKFNVYFSGWTPVSATSYNQNVSLFGYNNDTPPSDYQSVLNFLCNASTMKSLFSNTLPPVLNELQNANWRPYFDRYFYLPNVYSNTSNFIPDYDNGTITIQRMAVFYYLDSNCDLQFAKPGTLDGNGHQFDASSSIQQWDDNWELPNTKFPCSGAPFKPFILKNVVFEGFKKAKETEIKADASFVNYPNVNNYFASDFLNSASNNQQKADKIKELIIKKDKNNKIIEEHLDSFFTNYDRNLIPEFEIKPSSTGNFEFDNLSGSITFNIEVYNNFFVKGPKGMEFIQNQKANNPANKIISKDVTVFGFKKTSPTKVNKIVNVHNLNTKIPGSNGVINFDNLYAFYVKNTNGGFDISIQNIVDLLNFGSNISQFISNPNPNTPINVSLNDINNVDIDFAQGTLSFNWTINSYIDNNGDFVSNPPSPPLVESITIRGFKQELETVPNTDTSSNNLTLDINNYQSLLPLKSNYFFSDQDLNNILIKDQNIIKNCFNNLPPKEIFDITSDVTVKINPTKVPGTPDKDNNNVYYREGQITLKNIIVADKTNSTKFILGEKTFTLRVIGFGNLSDTCSLFDQWNLSSINGTVQGVSFQDQLRKVDLQRATEVDLENLLNQTLDNGQKVFYQFTSNPISTGTSSTLVKVTKIVDKSNLSKGEIKVNIEYQNALVNALPGGTVKVQNPITLIGFTPVFKTIENNGGIFNVYFNALPSELIRDRNANPPPLTPVQQKFVDKLNLIQQSKTPFFSNGQNLKIVDYSVVEKGVNDAIGSMTIELMVKDYIDETGQQQTTPIWWQDSSKNYIQFNLSKLNCATETMVNKTNISLEEYFGSIPLPTRPSNIANMSATEYVSFIDAQIKLYGEYGWDEADIFSVFNSYLIQFIRPIYNYENKINPNENTFVPNFPDPANPPAKPINPFADKTPFDIFRSIKGTNILSSGILTPGTILVANNDQYLPDVNLSQKDDQLQSAFDYNIIKQSANGTPEFDIFDTLICDNRLGTISIKMKVKGMWTFDNKNKYGLVLNKNDNWSVAPEQTITLTISGFKKDVAVEENASLAIIISSSVGGALLLIIILIVIVLLIKKFVNW